jgi:hypothetical protein
MKRIVLALAAIAVAAAPMAGQAAEVADVECRGITPADTTVPNSASCSTTFELSGGDAFVSLVNGTHGNFLSPGASGSLTLTWLDAASAPVATITCQGVLALGPVPHAVGFMTDGAIYPDPGAVCSTTVHASSYAAGTQTLTVDATSARFRSATFWGRLVLTDAADPA